MLLHQIGDHWQRLATDDTWCLPNRSHRTNSLAMAEHMTTPDPFVTVPDRVRFLEELADREAIRDCLYRYCRGIDRCDADLLRSAFWPDALDSHAVPGKPPLNAHYFIERVIPLLEKMRVTQHQLANILIRIDGARATSESYFWAVHQEERQGEQQDVHAAGRYLDHMEMREGQWRIAHRHVLIDWFRVGDKASDWETGMFGKPSEMGDRFGRDHSNIFLAPR